MQKNAYCGGATDGWRHYFTKTLLVMKLTMILLIAGFLNVHATGNAQRINYSGKQVSLLQVFKEVEKQTGLVFFYERGLLDKTKSITIAASNMPLVQFLEEVLKEQPLKFNIQSKTIMISKKAAKKATAVMASNSEEEELVEADNPIIIRGRVVNEKGEPIPNVTVSVKGTTVRTVTNDNGDFGILLQNPKALIEFTSVTYETYIAAAPQNSNLLVVLKPRIAKLDEVTVLNTGFQTLSKERATGAFGKPDMGVVRQRTGTMDIIKRLEGQVPGLQIAIGSGSLTADQNKTGIVSQRAVIRGIASVVTTGEPLYVVNGIVVPDLGALNPDDVEDITVLKDAAASAIYGARAANGVLVINTRSGSTNQRITVNYTGFVNFIGRPDFGYRNLMNSQQYIQAAKETFDANVNPWWATMLFGVTTPPDQILYDQSRGLISEATANRKLDSLAAIDNLPQIKQLFYRPALTTNHTASVSGGNSAYTFSASMGYTGTQGNTKKNKSDAYKLYLSQNMHIGDRVNIQLNTSVINTISSNSAASVPDDSFLPYQLFRDNSGASISMPYLQAYGEDFRKDMEARSRIGLHYKPLDEIGMGYNKQENLNINVTGITSVKIWKGLKYTGNFGYTKTSGASTSYLDNGMLSQRQQIISFTMAPAPGVTPIYNLPNTGGTYTTGNTDARSWMIRNQLIFETDLAGGRDRLLVQIGQEAQQQSTVRNSNVLFGYDEALGTFSVLNLANLRRGMPGTVTGFGILTTPIGDVVKGVSRNDARFGLASYSFNQKYNIDLSWRADRSSLFGSDVSRQNRPFWSIGGKWRASRESFMESVKWVNELGIRATYGFTGNSPYAGSATLQDVFNAISSSSFQNAVAGDALSLSTKANRSLAWENTSNINLGVDFSILNGRISGSADYYIRNTTDLIGSVPINPFTGGASITGNIGKIRNSGVELSLRTVNIRTKDFSWSTTLNIGYNKNKLLSYSVPAAWQTVAQEQVSSSIEVVGYSLRPVFSYRYAGLDAMGDPQIYLADKSITKAPNVATLKDIIYSGTIQPKCSGGLSNSFNYRGIGLTLNMVYNLGAVMRDNVNRLYSGRIATATTLDRQNYNSSFAARWKKPGDEAFTAIPSFVADNNVSYGRRDIEHYTQSDIATVSADYIKLRDVTLSYTLQPNALKSIRMVQVTFFAQANNYMIWRANKSAIDPEFYNPLSGTRTLPPYKHTYSAGLNMTF